METKYSKPSMSNPTRRLHARTIGDKSKQTIVFIPGFMGSIETWSQSYLDLSENFRIVLIDTLGFSDSPKPDSTYTMQEHLLAIRETLQSEVNPIYMVGYSMGCILAAGYASMFPESVDRLVFIAFPYYRNDDEARKIIENSTLFNRLLAMDTPLAHITCDVMCRLRPLFTWIVPLLVRNVPKVVARDALKHTWESYSRTLNNILLNANSHADLAKLKQPMLFFHGVYDRLAPVENVVELTGRFPTVDLVLMKSGHGLVFSQAKQISRSIIGFLSNDQTNTGDSDGTPP